MNNSATPQSPAERLGIAVVNIARAISAHAMDLDHQCPFGIAVAQEDGVPCAAIVIYSPDDELRGALLQIGIRAIDLIIRQSGNPGGEIHQAKFPEEE